MIFSQYCNRLVSGCSSSFIVWYSWRLCFLIADNGAGIGELHIRQARFAPLPQAVANAGAIPWQDAVQAVVVGGKYPVAVPRLPQHTGAQHQATTHQDK